MVCGRNVQLMPTLFLKHTKMWQRENGKFVDFIDPSQQETPWNNYKWIILPETSFKSLRS